MANVPKAVLYYYPSSVWSAVARLAFEEKGYAADEYDLKVVDLRRGEQFDPSFLRLNPKATVPTLLVPYENSLTDGVESRYKAITESKDIVDFLDKSRSARSRTHTTSNAPAPSLTPATIAGSTSTRVIIDDILHSEIADMTKLTFFNARDETSLKKLAAYRIEGVRHTKAALEGYIAHAEEETIRVSEKVKQLWKAKLASVSFILKVLEGANQTEAELDEGGRTTRADYFKIARQAWEVDLVDVLGQLDREMTGPYTLGDQFSVADLHLAAWLSRVVFLSGGTNQDDGKTMVKRLEEYIGVGISIRCEFVVGRGEKQTKIGAFWDGIRERASWKKIYGPGLF